MSEQRSDATPVPELLEELRNLADELGKTPTKTEMSELGPYSYGSYTYRFGTWDAAVEAAGLEPNVGKGIVIPDEDLLAELRRVADELGHAPTIREMREHGDHGVRTYQSRFGSWNEAIEEAGLTPNRSGLTGKHNQIIQQLREAEQ